MAFFSYFCMVKFMKQTGLLYIAWSAMLVLFAGCSDDDDGGVKPLAQLEAKTVNCITTTDRLLTQGPKGQTFRAKIVLAAGEEWCSFDPASRLATTAGGAVGEALPLYLEENSTDEYRAAEISVTYSGGYSVTLRLWQMPYSATPEYDRAWGELPGYREDANYIYKTYNTTLISTKYNVGGYRRNFTICYDRELRVAHWVAYPLHGCYTQPNVGRSDAWAYDPNTQSPTIASSEQSSIVKGAFSNPSGVRGHQCPSADRYNTTATNAMTFYATNIMPQNWDFNGGSWVKLEIKMRDWAPLVSTRIRYDTLFVVTGTHFDGTLSTDRDGKKVGYPDKCWKVLLQQKSNQNKQIWECGADELKAIGFIFPNSSVAKDMRLSAAACTVEYIEEQTGFKFFQNLDPDVADAVKKQKNIADWPGIY